VNAFREEIERMQNEPAAEQKRNQLPLLDEVPPKRSGEDAKS
jgi:transcriptional repressor NrdR